MRNARLVMYADLTSFFNAEREGTAILSRRLVRISQTFSIGMSDCAVRKTEILGQL